MRLGEIAGAIAAVEQASGGLQVYSEVNATPSEVNVFVVRDGMDLAYVVHGKAVDAPPVVGPYTGATFSAAEVAFQPAVLDRIVKTIKDSEVVAFSVTPHEGGGVDYIATVRAPSGEFRVLLDASGNVLSVA